MEQVLSNTFSGFDMKSCGGGGVAVRELDAAESEAVSGGILPALGLAGALIGHTGIVGATGGTISMGVGVAAHVVSGFGLGYAAFEFAKYAGGGGRTKRIGPKQR